MSPKHKADELVRFGAKMSPEEAGGRLYRRMGAQFTCTGCGELCLLKGPVSATTVRCPNCGPQRECYAQGGLYARHHADCTAVSYAVDSGCAEACSLRQHHDMRATTAKAVKVET